MKGEIWILCFFRENSWNQIGNFTMNQLLASVIRIKQIALQCSEHIMSRCLQAKVEWLVRDALKSKSWSELEVGKDGRSFPNQTTYGSRTFTCNYLQFKTITLSRYINAVMKCNFYLMWLYCGKLPGGVLFTGRYRGMRSSGDRDQASWKLQLFENTDDTRPGDTAARGQLVMVSVLLSTLVTMSESFMITII